MPDFLTDYVPPISSIPGPRGAKGDSGAPGAAATAGKSSYTLTTSAFVMPAASAPVTITVQDSSWMAAGQSIFIEGAGQFLVTTILSATSVVVTAQDVPSNTAAATAIAAGKKVTPGGIAFIDTTALDELGERVYVLETTPGGNRNYYTATAPSGGSYMVGDVWFDTNDGNRIYRWDGTGWADVQRVLDLDDFGTGIKPVRTVASLPPSGAIGDFVILSTDNKIYRGTGSGWTKAISTGELTGQIDGTFIVDGAIVAQKIAAGAVTADKVGTNQIIAHSANIGEGVITNAHIANLSAGKITAGDIQSVNIGYAGRIFHPSYSTRKFRSVEFGTSFGDAKVFSAGNCLSSGYGHAAPIVAYAPGHVGWTSSVVTACPDSDGRVRVQVQGRLLGYAGGNILIYCQLGSAEPVALAALHSGDDDNAYADCMRILATVAATDTVKIYVAPADSNGVITPATCRFEVDAMFFNW